MYHLNLKIIFLSEIYTTYFRVQEMGLFRKSPDPPLTRTVDENVERPHHHK